jgi:hypothetical protein
VLQRLEIEPPIDESQSRPAPCVFGSVRGAGAARGGGGSFCSRRPEAEVVASGATAGGLPATRAPRVTATTQHYRAPLRTRQLTGVEPSGTLQIHFSSGTEIPCMRAVLYATSQCLLSTTPRRAYVFTQYLHNIRIHIMVGSTWLLRRAGYGALSRAGVSCGPLLAPTGPGRASSGNAGLRPK